MTVVDASAVAALVFGEPEGTAVAARLEGHPVAAPTLLAYEIGSVCLKKVRRHPRRRRALLSALAMATRMAVEEVDVPMAEVVDLARATGLTVYDAAYLWLARALDVELVTLDERLRRAAGRS